MAEVVPAGEQTMGGGLHSTLCPPLPLLFLTDTNREAAEELMEVNQMRLPGEERRSGRRTEVVLLLTVMSSDGGVGRRWPVNGSCQTLDLTGRRERGASGGGLTCRGERASLSRRGESSRSASLRLSEADSNNRLQG